MSDAIIMLPIVAVEAIMTSNFLGEGVGESPCRMKPCN